MERGGEINPVDHLGVVNQLLHWWGREQIARVFVMNHDAGLKAKSSLHISKAKLTITGLNVSHKTDHFQGCRH